METALVSGLQDAAAQGYVNMNFFALNRFFAAVAPGVVPPQNFQVPNNLDYLLYYINGNVNEPAGTFIPNPDFDINLSDNSTGWLFSDQAVHWGQIVGTAERPFILPEPKLIPSNSSVDINLTNNTAGTTFARLNIGFFGVQVRYNRGFNREDNPYYWNQ